MSKESCTSIATVFCGSSDVKEPHLCVSLCKTDGFLLVQPPKFLLRGRVWAALFAEFLGLAIFQIYGGSANDDVAAFGNGITLCILGMLMPSKHTPSSLGLMMHCAHS